MTTTENIIDIKNLNYRYAQGEPILKNLNLSVPRGSIYGFLGSNGAGKSTTIRAVLGLLKPQSGEIEVLGKSLSEKPYEILREIGSLIESPSLYKHLSGQDILKIACTYLDVPKTRIDEVLTLVNLEKQADKLSKNYSMGMKQRLGLALALLSKPELLILDEPTNGLDPKGILEIRTIIQELNNNGTTILISSHLLFEIEKIVTQVGILKGGKLIFQGSKAALDQLKTQQQTVHVICSDAEKAMTFLSRFNVSKIEHDKLEISVQKREQHTEIIRTLLNQDIEIYEFVQNNQNLEQLFLQLTND